MGGVEEGVKDGGTTTTPKPPKKKKHPFSFTVAMFTLLALLALARFTVAAPYYVPSPSMEPTLPVKTTIIVNHLAGNFGRGDVVVFTSPDTWHLPDQVMVKRIIGVPGDSLDCTDEGLIVNGAVENEHYDCSRFPAGLDTVEGGMWVMGDNRQYSADSSYIDTDGSINGVVPVELIKGKQWTSVPFSLEGLFS